jgi:Ca2+-binding RTX toxin-like protein
LITEGAGTGDGFTDTVISSITYTLADKPNLENVTLAAGAGNINATGNAAANALAGNEGNNVLNGLGGVDTMAGGAGNDTYVVNDTGEQLTATEDPDAGTDTVQSSVSWTLGDNFENLTLTGTANLAGTGNTADNVLTGNGGANTLSGGSGNDTLAGAAGNDILQGGEGDDSFVFDAADLAASGAVDGGAGNDTLVLAGAAQTLNLITAPDGRYLGIEVIDLTGTGANTLLLNPSDVVALSDTTNRLVVNGNIGDVLKSIGQGWTSTGTQSVGAIVYATFEHSSGAELWVDTEIGFTVT